MFGQFKGLGRSNKSPHVNIMLLKEYLKQKEEHSQKAEIARNARKDAQQAKKEAEKLKMEAIDEALRGLHPRNAETSPFLIDYRNLSYISHGRLGELIREQKEEARNLAHLIESLTDRKGLILKELAELPRDQRERVIFNGCLSLDAKKLLKEL